MTDLFLNILNLSFSATWVVLAVILARLLLRKAPRWMVCCLWALVALRLLFGGIEAPFSLIPSSEIITPESQYDAAPVIHSGISIIDNSINPIYSESLRPTPGASVNPLQIWLAVFANLWVLGMGAMAIWAAVSCHRVRKQVRESIPAEVGVYLCDRIDSPFIFGLFRPKIYLPPVLDGNSHVIAHEKAHLARRDHWWKPLGFALLTVNWFNPAMWLAYILLCRDIEMACDEKAVKNFTIEEKKAYSTALLHCSVNARPITACPLAFGEVGVKQRVRSVLNYKKPAFWIILTAVVLTAVLAVGLLTDPLSPDAEIRWDNVLYIREGRPLKELPADAELVGILRSTLHDQTDHPDENSQSVHLGWEYAGQPLYLTDAALYIEEPGGERWLPFVPKHSLDDVLALLDDTVQIELFLEGSTVSISEFLRDYLTNEDQLHLREILSAENLHLEPSRDWTTPMLAVNYADNITIIICPKDQTDQCTLIRRESDWLMIYRDEDWAVSAWAFQSPELDDALLQWQSELAFSAELFSEFATADDPIYLDYNTVSLDGIALRMGLPSASFGFNNSDTYWEWQGNASYDDNTLTIQCRPYGRQDWMEICYRDPRDFLYHYASDEEPITLENGMTGTLFYSDDPALWSEIVLYTTRGVLDINAPNRAIQFTDWKLDDYRMALTILGTLSLTEDGDPLFSDPSPLGITLSVENVTPNGATLICTQDGTLWDEISTGAVFHLDRYKDGTWVSIMPESAAWTTEAHMIACGSSRSWNLNWTQLVGSLEPGTYRVSKVFWGERNPIFTLGLEKERIHQTIYAEFVIGGEDPSLRTEVGFSPELQQAVVEDWRSYDSMEPFDRLASSKIPGSCTREFGSWADVEQFIGMKIPNPLEELGILEKGNWAAAPLGFNFASRFYVTWSGTREGVVQQLNVQSGYRQGDLRVSLNISFPSEQQTQNHTPGQIIHDEGDGFEAQTVTVSCGNAEYTLRAMGDPGSGNQLTALLEELLPYFEEIPNL